MSDWTNVKPSLGSNLSTDVLVKGTGDPLVFLHGHKGRNTDSFLESLAEKFTVYAPRHPGADDPGDLTHLDTFSDLVLYYDDLIGALDIKNPILVGHEFGAAVAAEFAAAYPNSVRSLILIGALGLWKDDEPVVDVHGTPPEEVSLLLASDPASDAVRHLFELPQDPAEMGKAIVAQMSTVAAVNHFIWPIPDRDLVRRLYRILAPTLVVWGENDRYVPVSYAAEFTSKIAAAKTEIIRNAGHFVQLEETEKVVSAIGKFVDESKAA